MVNSLTRYTCVLTLTLSLAINASLHAMNAQASAAHESEYLVPLHILEQQLEPFINVKACASIIANYALLLTSDAKKANSELEKGIENDNYELVSCALKSFANIEEKTTRGISYISCNILLRHSPLITEELLKYNADPNALTPTGDTLLHNAVTIKDVQLLINYKAAINAVNSTGCNILFESFLTSHGGIINIPLLIELGADIHHRNKHGHTPLHAATQSHKTYVVNELLKAKADANATDNAGDTPLHTLIQGHRNAVNSIESYNIIRLLINANANPLAKNNAGATAADLCTFDLELKAAIENEYNGNKKDLEN